MANVKINTGTKEAPKTNNIAKRENAPLANPTAAIAGLEGDWGQSDMKAPYLKVVQPTSDVVETLGSDVIGHFLLDDVHDLGKTIKAVCFGLAKQYVEVLGKDEEFDPGNPPATFKTKGEAEEAGVEDIKPFSIVDLAIEIPEGNSADAIFTVENRNWALARFYARGRSHYNCGCPIFQACSTKGDVTFANREFQITAINKPIKGRNFRVAFAKSIGETSEALRTKVGELIG